MSDGEILLGREGRIATLTINRPQALNALTLANVPAHRPGAARPGPSTPRCMPSSCAAPAGAPSAPAAMCARSTRPGAGSPAIRTLTAVFFREEYRADPPDPPLSRSPISRSSTGSRWAAAPGSRSTAPTGSRPSARCSRCRRPRSGCFPMSAPLGFSNRCPGHIGRYLGLTGARLRAADALYCGFATHVVAQDGSRHWSPHSAALRGRRAMSASRPTPSLACFATDAEPPPLAALRPAIDRCFAADHVEAILAALAAEAQAGGPMAGWAAETRAGLLTGRRPASRSPCTSWRSGGITISIRR